MEKQRRRIPDKDLAYYESVIAVSLRIIDNLKPAIHRVSSDDLDLLIDAIRDANWIRKRTIREMDKRKDQAANGEQD